MRGIQYINDANGKPLRAVVDLQLYAAEFAVFAQELAKRQVNKTNPQPETPVVGDAIGLVGSATGINARVIKADTLLKNARQYIGTPYRTGGTTASGMDCSGFMLVIFQSIGIQLPRVSRDQATVGTALQTNQLQAGDLVFFATGTPGRINHVGVVSVVNGSDIRFVHASSSRGVIEDNFLSDYWRKAYLAARRVF